MAGTFDGLHRGHRRLFQRALELGDYLVVGLTSDAMIDKAAAPFKKRKADLEEFLKGVPHKIIKLEDPLGPAVSMEDLKFLVVSEETVGRAREINKVRIEKALPPLEVVVVPMVMAEDRRPISSTRIRRGEIDGDGRVI